MCSPIGPEIRRGYPWLINRLGGVGILYYWYKANRFIRDNHHKYDIIILHNPFIFLPLENKRVYVVVHTTYLHMFKEILHRRVQLYPYYLFMILVEKWSFFCLKEFQYIVTSPKTIKDLESFGIKKDIPIIFNGVKLQNLRTITTPVEYQHLNKDDKVFLNVCRFVEQKNLLNLIKTFIFLPNNYKLFLVGDGVLKDKLTSYVKDNNINNVFFTGRKIKNELPNFYSKSHFFISSSIYEGFPLVLSEAMGYGAIPCLSRIEIYSTIINECKCGVLLSFADPEITATDIIKFVQNINLAEIKSNLVEYSKNNLLWETIIKQYLDVFI